MIILQISHFAYFLASLDEHIFAVVHLFGENGVSEVVDG